MKRKSRKLYLVVAIVFAIIIVFQTLAYANTPSTPLYLGITELRTRVEPNMGYAIGDPNVGGSKIWNFVKYASSTSNTTSPIAAYCLKAGVGFSDTNRRETYNVFYDMIKERTQISSQNDILRGLVNDGQYNAILASLDILYVPGESTEADKTALLKAAGINYPEEWDYRMTDDDIETIQQAVVWYFTNHEDPKYDKIANTHWLNYTLDGNAYTSLSDYKLNGEDGEGLQRQEQAELLYKYMINTAKANASKYDSELGVGQPVTVDTKTLLYEESSSNYIVGPIHITKNNDLPYTLDFTLKNGETNITEYKLLDKDKNEVSTKDPKDLVGNNFYISIPTTGITKVNIGLNVKYNSTGMTLWASTTNNQAQPVVVIQKKQEEVPTNLTITPKEKQFDLALRKYITKVNDKELANKRIPLIDESSLTTEATATYKHRKDPVSVKTGDIVTYNITVYNEGEKAGRATKIVDQLPTGLEYQEIVSGDYTLDNYDATTNKLSLNKKGTTNIEAYTTGNLKSETVTIKCKVTQSTSTTDEKILTNVAWIAEEFNAVDNITITNQAGADRDSEPMATPNVNKDNMAHYKGNTANNEVTPANPAYFYKGEQDDDDFEKLIIQSQEFDLKLVKRITEVNKQTVKERIEDVDVSKLNVDGSSKTTAEYKLNKTPISVKTKDLVKYTFRVYNEGYIDGYANQITEDIPEGLEFLWSEKEGDELNADTTLTPEEKEAIEFNQKMYWTYNKDLKTISTDYLSKEKELTPGSNLIKAFGQNDGTKTVADLKYKEVSVIFKVTAADASGKIIRNEACISENTDSFGNDVKDRDSDPHKWVKYEDDEDYDNVILQSFDLSLRKFIVAVSHNEEVADKDYLKNEDGTYTRAPIVDTSKLNTVGENGKLITTATYNHTKTPVEVTAADTVVYMLRVYNEGDIDGYAAEIKDHLPPYLKYIDNDFNKKYGWAASTDGRTVTSKYLDNQKISKATKNEEGKITLSYKEIPIMCKVNNDVQSNYKLTNIADITKYLDENKQTVNDRDSKENNVVLPSDENFPAYKDNEKGEYIPGQEDDDDFEKVIVKIFDLALRKWVSQAIIIEDGTQNITETGHTPYDDPEEIVKVDLHRKKLNSTTVKFKFGIRVINEGDIAGYAKELKDHIPEGLEMIESENPGWKNEGNGVVSTTALENKLLQPGEYADVEILLTWISNENNIGIFTNIAEISKDYNEKGIPDIDSIPDNFKDGEDDIDDASVMVSIETGQARIYFTLGIIILITIAGGVVLIKKYVL